MRTSSILITLSLLILIAIPLSVEAKPINKPILATREVCTNFSYLGSNYFFCVTLNPVVDCNGWFLDNVWPIPSKISYRSNWLGGSLMYAPIWNPSWDSGTWTDPNTLESYHWVAEFRMQPFGAPIGPFSVWHDFNILEPSSCMPTSPPCELTPRYYMYALYDANQPPGWLECCYIISNNGFPSVESQARICSVPGFDHVYRSTGLAYAGWVNTDCNGNASYGWPAWKPSWYRPEFAK